MTYSIYFSPTGGTQRVMDILAAGFDEDTQELDLTVQPTKLELTAADVCLVGVPSFGGRVPAAALERLDYLTGNGAKAVAVAVYGNRHYDDTLLELQHRLENRGFTVVAGIAAVAEHSVVRQFGTGRPHAVDAQQLREFAVAIREKLEKEAEPVTLPGNVPYKEFGGAPFRPVAAEHCTKCGLCAAQCPVGAIPAEAPHTTNNEICFACLRCISVCPSKARALPDAVIRTMTEKLRHACETPKENLLFL